MIGRSGCGNNPPLHSTAAAERFLKFEWSSTRPRPVNGIPLCRLATGGMMLRYFIAWNLWIVAGVSLLLGRGYARQSPDFYTVFGL
jgi:hypothetical protein